MKRVYHKDDYKSMAVDLLCIASNLEVISAICSFGSVEEVKAIVRAAAILTHVSNNITSAPQVIDDTPFKERVYEEH